MKLSKFCFRDSEIQQYIETQKLIGKCDITGKENVHIFDTKSENNVKEMLTTFVEAYDLAQSLSDSFPKKK